MSDRWINLSDLVALTGWSPRAIQMKVRDGSLESRITAQRGRNGRSLREYSVLSLSPEHQVTLQRRRAAEQAQANIGPTDDDAQLALFREKSVVASAAPRVPVTDAHTKQIESRLTILAPLLEYSKLATRNARQAWCAHHRIFAPNAEALVKQIAKANGLSSATVWRWYGKYKSGGTAELFDAARRDKGQSRWFSRHQQAAIYVGSKYWGERMGIRAIRRAMERDREMLGLEVAELPSCDTVRVFLRSLPKAPGILAREGERKFNEECLPYMRRAYTERANEIWVSDHMISDVLVWDDCFERDGKPRRLRLTMVLDFSSRKALGYTFCLEGSSWSITTAVRNAILRFGPCKAFYADNGKDYRKVARVPIQREWWQEELTQVAGLLQRLGIEAQHCLRYHPQSKNVERSFRTYHQQFDACFVAGYTTGKSYDRPDITRVAEREHSRAAKRGRVEESPLCPASVYVETFRAWVENEYNNAPHSGQGMNGRSPNEIYDEQYPPSDRPAIDLTEVAHLFYERARRKVDSCAIRHNNRRYIGATAEAANALLLRSQEEIWIAWDQNDPATAVALDEDGNVIAPLKVETLMPQSDEARPFIAESMAQRRGMQRRLAEGIRNVGAAARAMGVRTEREHLEIAAGLDPAPDSRGASTSLAIITPRPASQAKSAATRERLQSEEIADLAIAEIRRAHA